MIPTPPPPTDNLYKFMAIAGTVLLIGGLLYPQIVKERGQPERDALRKELQAAKALMDKSKVALDNAPEIIGEDGKKYHDAREFFDIIDGVFSQMPALNEASGKWSAMQERVRWWRWVGYSGASIGAVMAVAGFWMWRTRLQRLQDRILHYQLEEAERKARPTTQP